MDNRAVNEEILETTGPYVGLRPYEESHADIFFGREQERDILIDKVIANKLTLLFAASGVGKSSLLQAGVLPALKYKKREPLDVVYYCDWVSDPLDRLKKETASVLRSRNKIAPGYSVTREGEDISLKKFFLLAATFASEPLVVILDQFEEFFQYRRYKENFTRFIEELSECVTDRDRQVVFLVSMREDFALELNIFKKYLPTILFENYFRLEKLTVEKAREAIVKPLEPLGFGYEGKLLETLLTDLAQREEEARMGVAPATLANDTPLYVEPPYLQIVCSRLWEVDKENPDKKIREESYEQMGGARGVVDSYFNGVMETFSYRGKNTASYAFDLLITSRGTKMAYTVEDLSDRTGGEEKDLEHTLEKLRKARILRSQKREGTIWYELYHDIFSNIIYRWNEKFKNRRRIKRISYLSAIGIALILVLFVIVDIIANVSGHYLRLSVKETISDRVEVYRGKLKSPNIFNLQEYQAETFIDRDQVEPDKRFVEKQLGDFAELNLDLIGHLPLIERISAYWETGEINKAFDLLRSSISESDMTRSRKALALLPGFYSKKSYYLLKELLGKFYRIDMREEIVDALSEMPSSWIMDDFINLLKDKSEAVRQKVASILGEIRNEKAVETLLDMLRSPDPYIQGEVVFALGESGSEEAVEPLLELVTNTDVNLRISVARALGKIGSEKVVEPLINLLKDPIVESYAVYALRQISSKKAEEPLIDLLKNPNFNNRYTVAVFLGQIGSEKAVKPLLELLKEPEDGVWQSAAKSLEQIGSDKAIEPLLGLLKDPRGYVQHRAADVLGEMGNEKAVSPLINLLKGQKQNMQNLAAEVLGQIGSEKAVEPLIGVLKDPNPAVRASAAAALGQMDSDKAVEPLIGLLKDPNEYVRHSAAEVLGQIGSEKAVEPLIGVLKDPNPAVRTSAAAALGQMDSDKAVEPLIGLLKDPNEYVRHSAAVALGEIGSEKAVEPLLELLKDSNKYFWMLAAEALGEISSEKALEPLLGLLKALNWPVREPAARALGKIGSDKAVEPLLGMLNDPKEGVRASAAAALGEIGSEKAVVPLIGQLKDPYEFVRRNAAEIFGNIRDETTVNPLIDIIKYSNSDVRKSTAKSLGNIGDDGAVEPLMLLLKDPDEFVRRNAAEALGKIGNDKAVEPLLEVLKDPNEYVRRNAAEALGNIGSTKASEPLAILLNDIDPEVRRNTVLSLGKLSYRGKINIIKNLYTNQKEKFNVRITAAATLLKLGDESSLEYLKKISNADNINKRIEVAKALGEALSPQGNSILREMLRNENINVKETVITSLGKIKDKWIIPYLNQVLQYPNVRIREAVVGALAEIAVPESIDHLRKVSLNTGERMGTRGIAITGLTKIQHQDALKSLAELLDNESSTIQYKTVMAIGKNPPAASLPKDLVNRLKSRLKDKLAELENRKAKWRKIRDEKTDSYNEVELKNWNERLATVAPNEPMEFELAFALSRIDPYNEGIKLLGHHLANVRQGAWMGLGKCRDVTLIEILYQQRKHSDVPWFIHASYRAIDYILMNIEAFGGQEELNQLESLYKKLSAQEGKNFHEGVETRMEWTIDRLKELLTTNEK